MPKIKTSCPECASRYAIDESHIGKTARCKKCNARFVVADTEQGDQSKTTGKGGSEHQVATSTSEADVPAEWKIGDVILDQYEVRGVLGEGGMGRVYDVWHRGWSKRLAVKSPRPDYFKTERQKENFTREAETWMDLGLHPHVVSCFYVRTLGCIPRVFAECIEGGDLKQWIDSRKLYEGGCEEALKRMLDIAIQFAWGLQYAHEKGLIHQDIKPANVLLTAEGVAKVTDFGLAKARGESEEDDTVRDGRSLLASYGGMTPAYCSPEQANKETLSRRTDIWSWAVSVLEMFIGEITWRSGVAAPEILESYLDVGTEVEDVPPMPDALSNLVKQCLAYNQEDRPRSFGEICKRLLAVHLDIVGEEYARTKPNAAKLQADVWNNRGVSLWDLGKMEEAEAAFDEALRTNAQHARATFNRGLLRWRNCRATDADLVTQLEMIQRSCPDESEVAYALGMAHLARLDARRAVAMLEESEKLGGGVEVKWALQQARQILAETPQCLRTFEGHANWVASVAFSPDGRLCLSGSIDNTLRLWNAGTGECLQTLTIPSFLPKTTMPIAFSPDGCSYLSGGELLLLWNASTGERSRPFMGHLGEVTSVAFSPDGCCFLSGGKDKTLRLWDVSTGKCMRTLEGHTDIVESVAFNRDGRFCLSGSGYGSVGGDNTIRVWDVSTGKCLRTLKGHAREVTSVVFSPDGRLCLSGSRDNTLRLWSVSTGKCLRTFEGHSGCVESVAFNSNGRLCASGSWDTTLRVWEVSTGKCLRTLEGHTDIVNSVAFSLDGYFCLSGSNDATLRLWKLRNNSEQLCNARGLLSEPADSEMVVKTDRDFEDLLHRARQADGAGDIPAALSFLRNARNLPSGTLAASDLKHSVGKKCVKRGIPLAWLARTSTGHLDKVTSVSFSPEGGRFLSGGRDKAVWLWDVSTGECLRTFGEHTAYISSVEFSPDGRFCLSGSDDGTSWLWDAKTGDCLRTFKAHTKHVESVAFHPDGRLCASGSWDTNIRLWEISTGKCLRTFEGHTFPVSSVTFSPDGRFCLSGSWDTTLKLWEVSTGKCLRTFEGSAGMVTSVTFSPNGRFCLSGGGEVRLWDVSTGKCLRTFEGHSFMVSSIAFTPDGRMCLSGSEDATLRLWDVRTGECLRMFEGHAGPVTSIALSPFGRFCVSGGEDKTLRLWELDWEYEFPGWAEWDDRAKPYLQQFLTLHTPTLDGGITRTGKPEWTGDDFQQLLTDLQHRGYGWLRPEGVKAKLEEMGANWQGPPPLGREQ